MTSANGTNRTWPDVRLESAFGGRADVICSERVFPVLTHFGPQRKAALRFIFIKSLFARLQTQPFFPRLKSCGSAAGPNSAAPAGARCTRPRTRGRFLGQVRGDCKLLRCRWTKTRLSRSGSNPLGP